MFSPFWAMQKISEKCVYDPRMRALLVVLLGEVASSGTTLPVLVWAVLNVIKVFIRSTVKRSS
jgi:hypothetical protein